MTFEDWRNYFEANQNHFTSFDWEINETITDQERDIIRSSIRQFQKGENSEGKNLIKYAKDFGNPIYLETIKLFIKEEQRHALVLGKFMALNGIEKLKKHWVDDIFRKLRKLGSLENSVLVLITAEIIATVYYKALYRATQSRTLKSLCSQILEDEEMHINFQSFTLRQFYQKRSSAGRRFVRGFHRLLMFGTTVLVWFHHIRVLKAGAYTLRTFVDEVFTEFNRSHHMIIGEQLIRLEMPLKRGIA